MYKRNNMKIMIGAFIGLGTIMLVTLIYAAFTGQLNIAGSGVSRISKWDVHFENLSTITTSHTAKVLTQPRLASGTSIVDYSVSVTSPGDTVSFTVDVVNDGNYNAEITSVSVSSPSCSGDDSTSNNNVCSHLHYSLTYDGGASVQVGDTLYAKETNKMKVTLNYDDTVTASELPTEEVSISNLGITINFEKSSDALVKDNGEVADYKVYKQGDKITLYNEDYYVIEKSGADKDYVTLLKAEALTIEEVNTYGVGHINRYINGSVGVVNNRNGYGGIAFYTSETCGYVNGSNVMTNSTTDYSQSEIKYVIDAWAQAKFLNNELKTIDGYSARLITTTEYNTIPSTYSWQYNSQYWYWTMTPSNYGFAMLDIESNGRIRSGGITGSNGVVQPVINVYKSALETNNNNNNE